ncbi:ceramide kinase-like isoform X2 [Thunnus albacares]|uniref:ceramide kinase-like n=1 Tax=Thunnus maccoyii TaxID=8240 RepID=UPI001C4CE801|nr:ceramide kinase-like [Thunnus maccoyii]XP_044211564.1 ceramide kinase-like isoform X2 [Thunnus albacares]
MERPSRLLLLSELRVRNAAYEVSLSRSLLTWKRRVSSPVYHPFRPSVCQSVLVSEIISVKEEEEENSSKQKDDGSWRKIKEREGKDCRRAFTVLYVQRSRQYRWRCAEVTFTCPEEALCHHWVSSIREQLTTIASRPKHLLVYINPYGGKRRGKHIYEQKVAPLFAQAGVSTHVIVTEYANHARDHLRAEVELKKFDGVVCVGGDGMFSEIIHGLIWRTQMDGGIDPNCLDETLLPCSLRIGIIPAGSTDCICFATVGTNDPVTSALHIIVGDSQPMDVCSVHHNNTLLRYSVSLLGYGFYGDVLTDSERKRWMGPARYDLSGLKMFLTHHYYEGTVSYLPARDIMGTPRDAARCRSGCVVCQHSGQLLSERAERYETDEVSESESDGEWRTVRGKFLAINAASMSCACPRSPKGLSPAAHLADGTTDLILVRKCSRFDFLRHLLRHTSKDDQFDLTFVEVHRVRRFRFTPRHCQSDSDLELDLHENGKRQIFSQICRDHPACSCTPAYSSWNCDGEILTHTAIDVRAHCQLIKLFARGIEEPTVFEDLTNPCAI